MGQGISTTQWYVYGRKHFTQSGYIRHLQKYSTPVQNRADIGINGKGSDGIDMSNQVIVVSGANSGLGKELATYAAAKGSKVYMLCRSKERAEAAQEEIMRKSNNQNVEYILVDVGELKQVRSAVKDLQSKESKIDCLVCNAGVLLNEKKLTSEGMESTVASHLIGGSYLLTKLLIPQLEAATQKGRDARVIYVTSGGMYLTKFPSWNVATSTAKGEKYDGVSTYSRAKRGQVILAEEFGKIYDGITFMSAHPGWADTPAVHDAFGSAKRMFEPLRTPWTGAEGISWMMGAKKDELKNGAFYLDRSVQPKHIAGPFMREGSSTKNSDVEINTFMEELRKACDGI